MKHQLLTLAILLSMTGIGYAEPLNDDMGVRAVIGESGPSYEEMSAIAHAIRNRGHFTQVFGLNRVRWFGTTLKVKVKKSWQVVSDDTIQQATKAWWNSERVSDGLNEPDPVKGATNWLSDWDIQNCRPELTNWRFKMNETAYVGSTHFYRKK